MTPKKRLIPPGLLAIAVLAAGPGAAHAAIEACFEFPTEASIAARNVGAKGQVELTIAAPGCVALAAGDPQLPLSVAGTTVSLDLTVGGAPTTVNCSAGDLLPDPGTCGFDLVEGLFSNPGVQDTVRVVYGGLFEPSDTITVTVNGVEDATTATASRTWSFSTSASPPRTPAAVELVFDVSGSMGWAAVPGGSVDRMTALQSAAQSFFALLGDYTIPGDQLGAIYFSTTAEAFDAPPGSNLKPADDPAEAGAVQTDLQGRTPTNATSIGAGLDLADSPTGFGATTARKFVLLFSDGEQNTAPLVSVAGGTTLEVGGASYDSAITVCPITAGRQTAPGFALQQQIADASCDGHNAHVRDTEETFVQADLETFFLQDLSEILVGDKLEPVRDVTGSLTAGEVASETFVASEGDVSLSVFLSWDAPGPVIEATARRFRLPFELIAPDGTVLDVRRFTRFGSGMSFTTVPLPAIAGAARVPTAGEWTVRLLGEDLPVNTLGYHLVALVDNTTLVSEFRAGTGDPGTGEDIPLSVTLTEDGAPVTGGTVVARLAGPREGLGDVLSEAEGGTAPADAGQNPVAQGKLFALLQDADAAELLALEDLGVVPLEDPDDDGVYTGSFQGPGADEEGHYHFVVDVEAQGAATGTYRRTRRLSVFVRPKPDPGNTDLVVAGLQPIDLDVGTGTLATFQATARDRFGNRIGPGYIGSLQIRSSAGVVHEPLRDLGDGTYEIVYLLQEGEDPEVTLEVLGEEVESDRASELAGGEPLGGKKRRGRWSLHAGATFSHGALDAGADGSWSVGVDGRWPLAPGRAPGFEVEAYLGHDRFDASAGDDPHFTLFTGRVRWSPGGTAVRPSLFAGIGPAVDRDDDVLLALEAGVALEVPVGPWAFELSYAHRNMDTSLDYGVAQLGVLFDF